MFVHWHPSCSLRLVPTFIVCFHLHEIKESSPEPALHCFVGGGFSPGSIIIRCMSHVRRHSCPRLSLHPLIIDRSAWCGVCKTKKFWRQVFWRRSGALLQKSKKRAAHVKIDLASCGRWLIIFWVVTYRFVCSSCAPWAPKTTSQGPSSAILPCLLGALPPASSSSFYDHNTFCVVLFSIFPNLPKYKQSCAGLHDLWTRSWNIKAQVLFTFCYFSVCVDSSNLSFYLSQGHSDNVFFESSKPHFELCDSKSLWVDLTNAWNLDTLSFGWKFTKNWSTGRRLIQLQVH